MKVHLSALGCRLNEAELEQWAADFTQAGYILSDSAGDADVMVMNTCAVTREAVAKSRRKLNRLQRENPAAKLVVSGCYSSLESSASLAELGVDLVVPNTDKDRLVPLTHQAFADAAMPEGATQPDGAPLFRRNRHRAFIKIQDGCRYRCTFCIVTVARGPERSRQISEILNEVRALHKDGVREIVLTGVHVGGYGHELDTDLATLVRALLAETEMERIRFASVEPWDLSPDFFDLFVNPRVQPHMHLPLQSGCDSVLKRMARRCKTKDFANLTRTLYETEPGFNVTTDIITGFPGESDAEWRQTMDFIRTQAFGHIHVFTYSEREGTKAANLPDSVPLAVRQIRSRELRTLADELRNSRLQAAIGETVSVLWERGKRITLDKGGEGWQHAGYTPNYLKVCTTSSNNLANQILPTLITSLDTNLLWGRTTATD
ncbi:MAG: tRNA (N(6)-L-threonylcarbamoyladenosine(37)-C(2))-methylthiotransferase MtaB [Granulosicoccus sp.]